MNYETRSPIYPERASANLDPLLKELEDIEKGNKKTLELAEAEKEALFDFENELGEKLESILKIKCPSFSFSGEYFTTPQGQKEFQETCGFKTEGKTVEEITDFILANRNRLAQAKTENLSKLFGKSINAWEINLKEQLNQTMDSSGNIDISQINLSPQATISLEPQKALEKLTALRNFKREFSEMEELAYESQELVQPKIVILKIYRKKINQLLVEMFQEIVPIKAMEQSLGREALTPEEQTLLTLYKGLESPERSLARMDKFIHGASKEYNERGEREQINPEIRQFAQEMSREYITNELERDNHLKEKGLDPKKIFKASITAEKMVTWAEEVLESYGQKSAYSPETYDIKRSGPAPDGKWQVVAREEFRGMSIDSRQKIVEIPLKTQSIRTVVATLLGHEIEGHFLQAQNKEQLPLKILKKSTLDRTSLFYEGGAMMIEDEVTAQAFGIRTIPNSHYVRAMIKKLEGGSFLECLKEFYESAIEPIRIQKEKGETSQDNFTKECRAKLSLATNRTRRLFRAGLFLNSTSQLLTKSKDAVYLEQALLLEKLKKAGMEKFALVGGVNLKALLSLAQIGLINLNDIQKPKFECLKAWKKLQDQYKLTPIE